MSDFRVEISEVSLDVMGRAFVSHVVYVRVEGILDSIVLLFRMGMRASHYYIVELCEFWPDGMMRDSAVAADSAHDNAAAGTVFLLVLLFYLVI